MFKSEIECIKLMVDFHKKLKIIKANKSECYKEKIKLLEQSLKQNLLNILIIDDKIEDIPKTNENIDFEAELIWDDTDDEKEKEEEEEDDEEDEEDEDEEEGEICYIELSKHDTWGCDIECKGWDGESRRCMCGNRRVYWNDNGDAECY